MGYVFQARIGKGGIIFTSKLFGGFSFETLHFLENHRPLWDLIKDRSLMKYSLEKNVTIVG